MPATANDDLKREIARLRKAGMTVTQISESLDCSISTVSKYADWADPESDPLPPSKVSESGDESKHEFAMRARIVTLEDAVRHAQVDLSVWTVDRWECTSWEMGYVKKDGEAASLPLWRVKLCLKRILPKPLLVAADAIYERFASAAPRTFPRPSGRRKGRPVMACFDLFDAHFGKLAWAPETGADYDLKIAERSFAAALDGLIEYSKPFQIDKAVVAVGNDFLHVDNTARQTTAGTPMDADGRLAKIVEVAAASMIQGIERLISTSSHVHLIYVPGNHDRVTSLFLCRELAAYFRRCGRVTVDCSPSTRKYIHWQKNLIGFTHGDALRSPQSLPVVMATERPREWADSVCREWHLGHLHTSRRFTTKDVNENAGVVMRWMSALSGTDSWHYDSGLVGNRRAAEVYLYSGRRGYTGHFVADGE